MDTNFKKTTNQWAVRSLVPEEVYTDRAEHLEYLYKTALEAIPRRSMSTVFLGQRRMGKTEIFKRVVNRLFFEQVDYADLRSSVVPVYYCFDEKPNNDLWQFAEKYVINFLRWITAFRLRNTEILSQEILKTSNLLEIIKDNTALKTELKGGLNLLEAIVDKDIPAPEEWALWLPRRISDWHEGTIAVFLDEFQNTRLPQYNFDIVGLMREAVESPTCPHFVTGSAMSILGSEIIGRGALFGRFRSRLIEALTEYWGAELALRCSRHYKSEMPEDMAPVIATRCGGNPFYITAVIQQAREQNKPLGDEDKINEILAVDLSSGFIWGELNDQVDRWIRRMNDYGITKWILYLSALEEGERIDLKRIQRELYEKEQKKVTIETIHEVLVKLSRGDLLEYIELGKWFRKVEDPILLDFLKVWGKIVVEGKNASDVQDELINRYSKLQRQINDNLGYIGEISMAQVLWNSQNKTLPGKYFHVSEDIPVSWRFSYIRHRVRLGAAEDMEVDVYGAAGKEVWLCESKWWRDRKAGVKEVDSLLKKGNFVNAEKGEYLRILRLWFFANSGFTEDAQVLMKEKGVLWSDRDDLDGLLTHVGLKRLPNV